jgi:rfaE bifunctional protein kinase chain/domain/rfaE bifunctional protein nucleotidyltransferase chain/domain
MKHNGNNKIKRLSTIAKIADRLKKNHKKIILCHGVFDLIHPGHIRYFASAKSHGDILIVTITADAFVNRGPGRPIFKQELRAEVLSAIEIIDFIAVIKSPSATPAIEAIRPDFYIKGADTKNRSEADLADNFPEEEKALKKTGGKLIFTEDNIIFSSSKLIGDYLDVFPPKTKKYLDAFKHKYSAGTVLEYLRNISKIKILVVGDTIIDQYHYVSPLGKSSKEPVMVHQFISHDVFIGGVLATTNHAASLSGNLKLVTLLGKKNSFKNFILSKLRPAVKAEFFYQSGESTIIKRRFVDVNNKQKLFQVSYLKDDFRISEKPENEILEYLNRDIGNYDMVIVNDFGHGMMSQKIIRLISKKAKYIALNVQANSANFGFNVITKYPRADYICIDNQEIRLATHDKFNDLKILMKKIYRKMKCGFMVVTRGSHGLMAYSQKTGYLEAPALSDKIVDRVGAGDALFAITSPCVFAGLPPDMISFMGNVAGALKVQVVGNKKQIEFTDMERFIKRLLS